MDKIIADGRIRFLIFLVAITGSILFLLSLAVKAEFQTNQNHRDEINEYAQFLNYQIRDEFDRLGLALRNNVHSRPVRGLAEVDLEYINNLILTNRGLRWIELCDIKGTVIRSELSDHVGLNRSNEGWFTRWNKSILVHGSMSDIPVFKSQFLDPGDHGLKKISVPILSDGGSVVGVVLFVWSWESFLKDVLSSHFNHSRDYSVVAVDDYGGMRVVFGGSYNRTLVEDYIKTYGFDNGYRRDFILSNVLKMNIEDSSDDCSIVLVKSDYRSKNLVLQRDAWLVLSFCAFVFLVIGFFNWKNVDVGKGGGAGRRGLFIVALGLAYEKFDCYMRGLKDFLSGWSSRASSCRADGAEWGGYFISPAKWLGYPIVKVGGSMGLGVFESLKRGFDYDTFKRFFPQLKRVGLSTTSLAFGFTRNFQSVYPFAKGYQAQSFFDLSYVGFDKESIRGWFNSFFDFFPESFSCWDVSSNCFYFSKGWNAVLGLDSAINVNLEQLSDLMSKSDMNNVREMMRSIFDHSFSSGFSCHFNVKHASGRLVSLECNAVVLRSQENGYPLQIIGLIKDRSEIDQLKKQANDSWIAAQLEAESNDGMSHFLEIACVEVSKPLGLINDFANQIVLGGLDLDRVSLARKILDATEAISSVLSAVNILSDLDSRGCDLHSVKFSLPSLVDGICIKAKSACIEKGIEFNYEKSLSGGGSFIGDINRIGVVIYNLLFHAIDVTQHGAVTIRLHLTAESSAHQDVVIEVIDNGGGCDGRRINDVFETPTPLSLTSGTAFVKLGLRLFVAKAIVDMFYGHIACDPVVGEGNKFLVRLPLFSADSVTDETYLD